LKRPVKTLPLSVRISSGTPHRRSPVDEGGAHRSSGGPFHQGGHHDEAGVVVDAGEGLQFGPVGEHDPADDVHLPQLHRPVPLPAHPVGPLPFAGLDEPVTQQRPVDRRARRRRVDPAAGDLMREPRRTPERMLAAQITHQRLDVGRHLMRARHRPV